MTYEKESHGRYYPTPPHPTPPTSTKHHGRLKVVQLNGNWSTKWRWNPTYKMHKMIQNVDQHISYTFIYQMCFISPIFLCLKPTLHLYFDPPRCAPHPPRPRLPRAPACAPWWSGNGQSGHSRWALVGPPSTTCNSSWERIFFGDQMPYWYIGYVMYICIVYIYTIVF